MIIIELNDDRDTFDSLEANLLGTANALVSNGEGVDPILAQAVAQADSVREDLVSGLGWIFRNLGSMGPLTVTQETRSWEIHGHDQVKILVRAEYE